MVERQTHRLRTGTTETNPHIRLIVANVTQYMMVTFSTNGAGVNRYPKDSIAPYSAWQNILRFDIKIPVHERKNGQIEPDQNEKFYSMKLR
jgi:hypothetical protein